MDHCGECGFTYADHGPVTLATEIADLGARYAAVLTDRGVNETRLNARSAPEIWSPVEYGCHVRDVLLVQRERLLLALVEDEPAFVPIYRDRRVDLARYGDETPGQVVSEIAFAAGLLAWVLDGLTGPRWGRTCTYNYPEPSQRTVLWLAQHTLHEEVHHLRDIERAVSAVDE